MFLHYLRIAFRNMSKQKMYTAIKIGGFAIGIGACLLIGLLIRHELNYDTEYANGPQIFRAIVGYMEKGKEEKAPVCRPLLPRP
ncbi:ABC transporter permease [Paraflavitalea speifideaquila]|uniref:ABC transporter permease n=1 Tax=Paraflavitalea speifideaquila TaxID=3076558 RepID=UPI0028E2F8A6|nr:ABC transporter permease [Paraflavitalea speifideiaquila]